MAPDHLTKLRELEEQIFATPPPAPGRLPIMPPALDPTNGADTWLYDATAAFTASGDLLIAWKHQRGQ